MKEDGDAGALERIRKGARSVQAVDNNAVAGGALKSSQGGDEDFGAAHLEGVEHVMDDQGSHGFANFNKCGDRRGAV